MIEVLELLEQLRGALAPPLDQDAWGLVRRVEAIIALMPGARDFEVPLARLRAAVTDVIVAHRDRHEPNQTPAIMAIAALSAMLRPRTGPDGWPSS